MLNGQAIAASHQQSLEKSRQKSAAQIFGDQTIRVRGARQHNLKGVDVDIPRDQMTVCCGLSGSGKSSLAMDTIYAEGQRRYVESLSAYARQFVGQMQKPKLDHIEGLSPAIAIEQKNLGHTPRIHGRHRHRDLRLSADSDGAAGQAVLPGVQRADRHAVGRRNHRKAHGRARAGTKLFLMAPLEIRVGEKYETLWDEMRASGYLRMRVDGETYTRR